MPMEKLQLAINAVIHGKHKSNKIDIYENHFFIVMLALASIIYLLKQTAAKCELILGNITL